MGVKDLRNIILYKNPLFFDSKTGYKYLIPNQNNALRIHKLSRNKLLVTYKIGDTFRKKGICFSIRMVIIRGVSVFFQS